MGNRSTSGSTTRGTATGSTQRLAAGLTPETVRILSGLPDGDHATNHFDARAMADQVTVTFRPLPDGYDRDEVIDLRNRLREELAACGIEVERWSDALDTPGGRVGGHVDAVIDVKRTYSFLRRRLIDAGELVYQFLLRSPERSIQDILEVTAWAEELTKERLQDPINTQVLNLTALKDEFMDEGTSYHRKISIGLRALINSMSEMVLGVCGEQCALINMNMSDRVFPLRHLRRHVVRSLAPKMYASIRPPGLFRFEQGTFDTSASTHVRSLVRMGRRLDGTELFPGGASFNHLISRPSRRDVLDRFLKGRTGVSYGFLAYIEPPRYRGNQRVSRKTWSTFSTPDRFDSDRVRRAPSGRWFVRVASGEDVQYRQVPDLWMVTTRSGCDKTDPDPERDLVRIGLTNGTLHLQMPEGVDPDRRSIRPSFDTYVMVAQALSAALYAPHMLEDGAPLVHFHGYPLPEWFRAGETHVGAMNPSVSCGTVEAALLNFAGVHEGAERTEPPRNLLCLVEPDHGVNMLSRSVDHLVDRLTEGASNGRIELGGAYLSALQEDVQKQSRSQ